jgi:hypothetical protein
VVYGRASRYIAIPLRLPRFPAIGNFHPLRLKNQNATVIHFEVAHETGKTNGAYIATPNWVSRSRCTYAYSDSPQLKVRFPDGYLSPSVTATWLNLPFVHC